MPGIRAGKPRRHLRGAPVPGRPKSGDGGGRRAADEVTPEKGHGGLLATSSTAPRPSLPPRSVSSILLSPSLHLVSQHLYIHRAQCPHPMGSRRAAVRAGRGAQQDSAGQVGAGRGARRCPLSLLRRHLAGAARRGGHGTCGTAPAAGRGLGPAAGPEPGSGPEPGVREWDRLNGK